MYQSVRHARHLLLPALLLPMAAMAEEAPEKSPLSGAVDLAISAVSGNSNSQTTSGAITGKYEGETWSHHLELRGKNTEENRTRSAESYRAALKNDFALSERSYLFLKNGWEKDRFNGYEWQYTAALGYGYKFIKSERQLLALEAGPGYRHDELPPPEENRDTSTAYAALDYWLKITDNTTFTEKYTVDYSDDDTVTRSLSELAVRLSDRLALKATLDIVRHSEPPAGSKNSDRTTTLSLSWAF